VKSDEPSESRGDHSLLPGGPDIKYSCVQKDLYVASN
jgi:hypothetical protein